MNLISTPGILPRVSDDATPGSEKADIGWDAQALVLLVPPITGLDLVAGVGTTVLIPALSGPTVYMVDRIQVVPETVDPAPAVQPVAQVETPAGVGDHVVSGAFSVAGTNFQDLTMVPVRPVLDSSAPNNLLNLVQTGLATSAGGYLVTVLVWGYVLTP
jgi:hypothetical protein